MWLFPCCGEEAVGYSLYHRQSAWGGDAPQNLCLLTSESWRFRAPQCCFCVAVTSWWEGALTPFWRREAFVSLELFFCLCVIIRMYWKPPEGKKAVHREVWSWISEEQELKCDLLACHSSPLRSLVFLQNGWAQFVRDGWLVSKGLCVKLFFINICIYVCMYVVSCFYNVLYLWSLGLLHPV